MRPVKFQYLALIALALASAATWWIVAGDSIQEPLSNSTGSQAHLQLPEPEALPEGIRAQTPPSAEQAANSIAATKQIVPRAETLGFGRFIDEAAAGRDPQASFDAAQLTVVCEQIDDVVGGRYRYLQENATAESIRKILHEELQRQQETQRKCQTVSETQIKLRSELLQQAALGSVFGAAKQFYMAKVVEGERPDEPWLLDALVRDANRGDLAAISILACDPIGEKLPDASRSSYYQAVAWAANRGAGERYANLARTKMIRCQPIPYSAVGEDAHLRNAILNVKAQAD